MLCHWSLGTAGLNDCAAASELSAYFPESTMANPAIRGRLGQLFRCRLGPVSAGPGVCWAWTEADSRRLIKSGDADFVGFAPPL